MTGKWGIGAFAAACAAMGAAQAHAAPACPPQMFRSQEDCRGLDGRDLSGLDRLRYIPLHIDPQAWLTLGGDVRVRNELFSSPEFGITGARDLNSVSGRLQVHADLRVANGPRLFGQLAIAEEHGRRPGSRLAEEGQADVAQLFVELPVKAGDADVTVRLGRQEMNLAGNRLVSARDGTTFRRTFQGVRVNATFGRSVLSVFDTRPVSLTPDAFDNPASPSETFKGFSLDLPPDRRRGRWTLFYFERERELGQYLEARGPELRRTAGAKYERRGPSYLVAQAQVQGGEVAGLEVKAYGVSAEAGWPLPAKLPARAAVLTGLFSGDGKPGDGVVGTFDPTYPNNGGISDAPLFYQTNYAYAGGEAAVIVHGAEIEASSYLIVRASTKDALYAQGAPIAATLGSSPLTTHIIGLSMRRPVGDRSDVLVSYMYGRALEGVHQMGGGSLEFLRLQLSSRF